MEQTNSEEGYLGCWLEGTLLQALGRHAPDLKTAFRFYCLHGASGSSDEGAEAMGMGAFSALCKALGLRLVAHDDACRIESG